MIFSLNPSNKILATLILSITVSAGLFAQSEFEGTIDYTISYVNMPEEMKAYESMLPKELIITIKGNKSRLVQSTMMGTNAVVSDMDGKKGFIEMEMGGQKFRMDVSNEEFEQEESSAPDNIEYLDETKDILGYECKKALMKDDAGNTIMTVFYTDQITNKGQKEFTSLKGFPLQYGMSQQNMTMEITATSMKNESVANSTFDKSEGFKEITQEELQQMMMGGGQ